MDAPKVTWKCEQPPRSDRSCPAWLTATEFQDHEDVARAKVSKDEFEFGYSLIIFQFETDELRV